MNCLLTLLVFSSLHQHSCPTPTETDYSHEQTNKLTSSYWRDYQNSPDWFSNFYYIKKCTEFWVDFADNHEGTCNQTLSLCEASLSQLADIDKARLSVQQTGPRPHLTGWRFLGFLQFQNSKLWDLDLVWSVTQLWLWKYVYE